ncbi:MAG TPA: phosphomannomutase/phosphoglucomutase [Chthonomonadaceae bacterium]|nr:phosphomannomutase/phosphoglucomutase [Chthonomonadaceae bacterium]
MTEVDPKVFRTYDIRALVPDLVDSSSAYYGKIGLAETYQAPLTPEGVEQIGRGLAAFFGTGPVVVGHDARLSSPVWVEALSSGIVQQGLDVLAIGLATTDMVYYASGQLDLPAVEITASHCSKELNGMKIVRAGAHIVGQGSGLERLRDLVVSGAFAEAPNPGKVTHRALLDEYLAHLLQFVDVEKIRPLKIVADAGNGAGGPVAQALFARLPQLAVNEMCFPPDGRFPHHDPNPFERENIEPLVARVQAEGADLGVAWDGDADRVFFVDERGEPVPGDFITALVARQMLARHPGAGVVYDLRASWAVPDWIKRAGGRPIPERVGHSYIKQTMRAQNAVFGGEVSGHYYFRDHFFADNGFIPLLSVLQMLSESNGSLRQLVAGLGDYYVTGEINSTVPDVAAVLERLKTRYADGRQDFTDGITVEYPDWRFNVRPSANDPLVRLNLEARTPEARTARREEVLAIIRKTP